MKDFKTSQIVELRKLAKNIFDMADSALNYRSQFIEDVGTTEYEARQRQSLCDPESFYHFKMFDKGVSIIRLYTKKDWLRIDEDSREYHFTIRCYNFNPHFKIEYRNYINHIDYGDFPNVKDCIKYFITACVMLADLEFGVVDYPLFVNEEKLSR